MTGEEHNEREAKRAIARTNDLKELWTMPSGAGRRILQEIIGDTEAMKSPYSNSGQSMACKVGKAEIGLKLIENLTMAGVDISTRECMNITEEEIKSTFKQHLETIKNRGRVD